MDFRGLLLCICVLKEAVDSGIAGFHMHLFRVLLCICRLVAIHLANMAALETVLAEKVIFAVVTLNIG